jgi:tight adherence protein B
VVDLPVWIFGGVVAVSVLVLVLLVSAWLGRRRAEEDRRLNGVEEREDAAVLAQALASRESGRWNQRVDNYFERLMQRTALGVDGPSAVALMFLAAVGMGGVIFFWRDDMVMGALGAVAGAVGVFVFFYLLRHRYQRMIQNQLPDTFFLLARSLRAGMSLEQALTMVAEQGNKPTADEFRRCVGQIHLGLSVAAALQRMAERLDLLDFNAFVSTVTLYHTTGGNLSMLLDRLAEGTRDRNQFRNYLLAATALGRVTAIFLACAAPALLLSYAIFQPKWVQAFFQAPTGAVTLALVVVLEVIGSVWLYRLLRIEL